MSFWGRREGERLQAKLNRLIQVSIEQSIKKMLLEGEQVVDLLREITGNFTMQIKLNCKNLPLDV